MLTPPINPNKRYANQTVTWHGSDTEFFYNKNIQDSSKAQYLKHMNWTDPTSIQYTFNSQGFRSNEFENKKNFLALGCSYTQGIGLPLEQTWAHMLGQTLNLEAYNLGIGGLAIDSCYRFLEYWLPKLTPEFVVLLCPPEARIELILDNDIEVFLPEAMSPNYNDREYYLSNWFMYDENRKINRRKNIAACKYLTDRVKTPLYVAAVDEWPVTASIGFARDFLHPGPAAQTLFVDRLLGMINA